MIGRLSGLLAEKNPPQIVLDVNGVGYELDVPMSTFYNLPAGGEKVTLKIAAKYADYTNFDGAPEGFAAKSEILRGHCADVGRDFGEITRSANYNVVIGETETDVEDRLQWMAEHFRRAGVPAHRSAMTARWRSLMPAMA